MMRSDTKTPGEGQALALRKGEAFTGDYAVPAMMFSISSLI